MLEHLILLLQSGYLIILHVVLPLLVCNFSLCFFSQSLDFSFRIANLCLGSGNFQIEGGLHLTQRSLESVGVVRLDLADESNHTVVSLEILARAFVSAPFADDIRLRTLVHNVRQVGVQSLVKLAVAAVVDTGSLLNKTLAPVLKSLVERVLLFAVFLIADDRDPFELLPLEVV